MRVSACQRPHNYRQRVVAVVVTDRWCRTHRSPRVIVAGHAVCVWRMEAAAGQPHRVSKIYDAHAHTNIAPHDARRSHSQTARNSLRRRRGHTPPSTCGSVYTRTSIPAAAAAAAECVHTVDYRRVRTCKRARACASNGARRFAVTITSDGVWRFRAGGPVHPPARTHTHTLSARRPAR